MRNYTTPVLWGALEESLHLPEIHKKFTWRRLRSHRRQYRRASDAVDARRHLALALRAALFFCVARFDADLLIEPVTSASLPVARAAKPATAACRTARRAAMFLPTCFTVAVIFSIIEGCFFFFAVLRFADPTAARFLAGADFVAMAAPLGNVVYKTESCGNMSHESRTRVIRDSTFENANDVPQVS